MPGSPFGTFGAAFSGGTSGYGAPHNPYATPPAEGWDRNRLEREDGRAALGFYATQPGVSAPFRDYLESAGTRQSLWTDYEGVFGSRNDPAYAFTDWLKENDPYDRYMRQSYAERGEVNPGVLSPFAKLENLG